MPKKSNTLTANIALIRSWHEIKNKYPFVIVLLREKDHYISFNGDAVLLARKIGARLNACPGEQWECTLGIHQLDIAMKVLIKAGYQLAICDPLMSK